MRTFAQKPKENQQTKSAKSTKPSLALSQKRHDVQSILNLQSKIGNRAVRQLLKSKIEDLEASSVSSVSTELPHDLSRIPVNASVLDKISPKLKVNTPGDQYEQEADLVAEQVLQQNLPSKGNYQRAEIQAKRLPQESKNNRHLSKDLKKQLYCSKGNGSLLSDHVRAFMESRMQFDFSKVRVHTDNKAAQMNQELGARALTHGNNIYFGAGQYNPSNSAGRHLLAHELVHVMQQSNAPRPADLRLTPAPANLVSGAWTSLGSFSWNHHIAHDHRVVLDVLVGNRPDWEQRLRNLDDSDEIWQAKGFMETAATPSLVSRARPMNQARALNYQNNVKRAPNASEILDFLRALYNLGESLDLADHTFEATGFTRSAFRSDLNEIINKYQGRLLQDISARDQSVSSAGIAGVVSETGRGTPIAMIQSAGATAMKAVDIIAAARQSGNSDALSNANALIRNAGRTIRYSLNAHDASVAFNNSVSQAVFDVIWSTLPGGGALASAGMEILKIGFKKMLEDASKDDEPRKQAQNILDQFITHVRRARREGYLGSDTIGVLVESTAITGFEAAMR